MEATQHKEKYLINWIGGKRLLRKTIAPLIPPAENYVEPFGGGAWLLFYKDKWAKCEIYNDLDARLYNLFNVVKYHPEALLKELEFSVYSRDLFNRSLTNAGVTDIQKAATFFYVITHSYGAKGEHFGYYKKDKTKSLKNMLERIKQVSERLDSVIIENLDYEELIKKYDHKGAFFYCDPPYSAGYKYKNSKNFDHERLFNVLSSIQGKFLLSYDASEQIKELYKGFNIKEVSRIQLLAPNNKEIYKEHIIKNF